jgi:hypothetical protein
MSAPRPAPPTMPPVRYGSRDGTSPPTAGPPCVVCGAPGPSRRAQYCSDACKQRAYRWRQAARPAPDLPGRQAELKCLRALAAQTLYECPLCGARYLGLQRCPECQRFCRALGLGALCPHCEEPLLLAEVLP